MSRIYYRGAKAAIVCFGKERKRLYNDCVVVIAVMHTCISTMYI